MIEPASALKAHRQNINLHWQVAVITVIRSVFTGNAEPRNQLLDQAVIVNLNIGYQPAQAALGYTEDNLDGSLINNNFGYVVITLRRQPNESALTNCEKAAFGLSEVCWVEGNITATLRYDVRNSFGLGNAEFYLPVMNDKEWEDNYLYYGFWDGRGYLRAESVTEDSAILSIYSASSVARPSGKGGFDYRLARYASNIKLGIGDSSRKVFLPGINPCLGNLQLTLQ